jgi:hypothetical protein
MSLPYNPLRDANIFSLDDMQVKHVPVGCANPYIRYASRVPLILQSDLLIDPTIFHRVLRVPTLGFRRFTGQLWLQYPSGGTVPGYLHYYFGEERDNSPTKPLTGGTVSPPYDSAVEYTDVDAKDLSLWIHAYIGSGTTIGLSFSLLVEP